MVLKGAWGPAYKANWVRDSYVWRLSGGPGSDIVVKDFHDALTRSPDTAVAVAAIKVCPAELIWCPVQWWY